MGTCPSCGALTTGPDGSGCPQCSAGLRTLAPWALEARQAAASSLGPPGASRGSSPPPVHETAGPEAVLAAIRDLRQGQDRLLENLKEILALLRAQPGPARLPLAGSFPVHREGVPAPLPHPGPRTQQRPKAVLVVDDDERTREEARAALEATHIPVRTAVDGPSALEAMAAEKPDVVALELAMGGSTAGQDVINMIKATMEWVHIPIVLYTRAPIASQRDAQIVHGADDLVAKGSAGAQALVERVIQIFQREA